jgi:hypothetical protein
MIHDGTLSANGVTLGSALPAGAHGRRPSPLLAVQVSY